jgi:Holliday junction resolvasome RuvABC DNA-binding subunit
MIAKLKGLVDSTGEDWVIIDVNGVGYLVQLAPCLVCQSSGRQHNF